MCSRREGPVWRVGCRSRAPGSELGTQSVPATSAGRGSHGAHGLLAPPRPGPLQPPLSPPGLRVLSLQVPQGCPNRSPCPLLSSRPFFLCHSNLALICSQPIAFPPQPHCSLRSPAHPNSSAGLLASGHRPPPHVAVCPCLQAASHLPPLLLPAGLCIGGGRPTSAAPSPLDREVPTLTQTFTNMPCAPPS